MKILFKYDSRDKEFYRTFGQAFEFPDELILDTPKFDDIQMPGDVRCTCFTVCDIAEDMTGVEYDIEDLWQRIPKQAKGATARDAFSEAVKNGLLPKGKTVREKRWNSYWRADTGDRDAFDNVRSALMLVNAPIGCGTWWYAEWMQPEILPVGKVPLLGHMYAVEGWKQVNGQPHLIIEAWNGRKSLMPRETFNEALKPSGMQAWVLSTVEIDGKRVKTLTETLKDLMMNLIILLRGKIKEKGVEPIAMEVPGVTLTVPIVEEPQGSKLIEWALAIRDYEGKPGDLNYKNNNPGNIKSVNGGFMKFKTYEAGWAALLDYLTRAATGKHRSYKPDFTLLRFFQTYAPSADSNDPAKYAEYVSKRIDVPVTEKIKNLI